MSRRMVGVILLCVSLAACLRESEWTSEEQRIQRIVEAQSAQPIDEYTVLRAPTAPVKLDFVIPEWEPVSALVTALPYDDAIRDETLLEYYMDIVENALHCVDVILLVDERELPSFKQILLHLRKRNLESHLQEEAQRRLFLVPARLNSKWLRDYGPVFARHADGGLCVTDAVYRDVREEPERAAAIDLYSLNPDLQLWLEDLFGALLDAAPEFADRHEDDSAPMYLTTFLDQQWDWDIRIARVPMLLWGGDVFFDGGGNVFLSSETLRMNGGRRDDVELMLRHYYGMRTLTCLEPLPGETIKHLDMIFKPAGPRTFLVADYPSSASDSDIYMQFLHTETRRILASNAERLRRKFPAHRLIRVPMPPLERISVLPDLAWDLTVKIYESKKYFLPDMLADHPEQWTFERFVFWLHALDCLYNHPDSEAFQPLIQILGIEDTDHFTAEEEETMNNLAAKLIQSDPALLEWLAEPYRKKGQEAGRPPVPLEKALEQLVNAFGYEDMIENPESYTYVYRTFLNMTYLNGPSGQMLLVPSYSGCEALEQPVREIYQELFPGAEIVFINSDAIIKQYGSIHCVTLTVPDLRRVPAQAGE
ncbi:MAG: hypothetical protein HPY51_01680 [Candidatus Omnitrophica bacterium]|nr:hypothetical protein [Candidatus Omnitrophota bacterium]